MKIITLFLASFLGLYACGATPESGGSSKSDNKVTSANTVDAASTAPSPTPKPAVTGDGPKTIRDFFTLLPEKYFTLEGCMRESDKECIKARAEYLKTFTQVEDTANGYFKGGCDGAQSCIEMAIFKRPDGTYLVGLATSGEMMNDFYFLDYKDGKWSDISSTVVPEFSKKNWYELPRVGTSVKVFAKKIVEQGKDYQISEKGKKLYDLEWKDGKFERKK
ncbi:MAG: hypothetical protein KA746_03745 [Pyrinomonadaceae bacterium]|nr:hypothetical protein [Pyrinomonadaceae bacterium]MBP6211466.1 hypothetical protein [Pyrinomonadaceae bacterium]